MLTNSDARRAAQIRNTTLGKHVDLRESQRMVGGGRFGQKHLPHIPLKAKVPLLSPYGRAARTPNAEGAALVLTAATPFITGRLVDCLDKSPAKP